MKKIIKTFILFGLIVSVVSSYAFQKEDEVYVIVGDKVILKSIIQQRAALENIPFDNAMKQLIEENLLLYEADKENIKVPPDEITKRLNEIEKKFPSSPDFLKFLHKNNFTDIKKFKNYLGEQLKVDNLIQKDVVRKIQISPVEIAREMKGINPGKTLMLRTMSFTTKNDEEDFVKEFHKNPSGEINKMQNIGWININELTVDIAKVIDNTPKGELSPPLKNSNQWTVFYVEDIKGTTLKDVYIQAREEIFKEKYHKQLDLFILGLKKQIPVTILSSE
ncbi:MAG: hypothetical protein M1501_03250 [Candidatus Omnitrophica bacterium]|nr:hypothetical protein [Candidatus Omnitrophota bacterium]